MQKCSTFGPNHPMIAVIRAPNGTKYVIRIADTTAATKFFER